MVTSEMPAPAVVLFLEGTSRSVELFQRIVSGFRRGGRRVYVFPRTEPAPAVPAAKMPLGLLGQSTVDA